MSLRQAHFGLNDSSDISIVPSNEILTAQGNQGERERGLLGTLVSDQIDGESSVREINLQRKVSQPSQQLFLPEKKQESMTVTVLTPRESIQENIQTMHSKQFTFNGQTQQKFNTFQVSAAETVEESGFVPQPIHRTQKVPYIHKFKGVQKYEVTIPTQFHQMRYYEVEHVTQYLKKEVPVYTWEVEPRQTIQYKLEYVPVDKKTVFLPDTDVVPVASSPVNLHHKSELIRHKSAGNFGQNLPTSTKQPPDNFLPFKNEAGQIVYKSRLLAGGQYPQRVKQPQAQTHHVTSDNYSFQGKTKETQDFEAKIRFLKQRQAMVHELLSQ